MARREIPGTAQSMHERLQALGVVEVVRRQLVSGAGGGPINDLLCWVEEEDDCICVKAAYRRVRSSAAGTNSYPDRASFRAAQNVPFGSITAPPLSSRMLEGIFRIAGYGLATRGA